MKKNILTTIIVAVFALLLIVAGTYAYRALSVDSPEKTVESFYNYWTNYEGNPLADKAYQDNENLSDDFAEKIDTIVASFDREAHDPILCAQDVPESFEVVNVETSDDSSTVTVSENFYGTERLIEVELRKMDNSWKINNIICQEGERSSEDTSAVSPAIKEQVSNHIEDNISSLSPEEAVLGGTFYVTAVTFTDANTAIVDYEDGHIALTAKAMFEVPSANEVKINSFTIIEEPESEINFSETGNIVDRDNSWKLVYEEPGQPALTVDLIFDNSTVCLDQNNNACAPAYWENGDRVEIKGYKEGDSVKVSQLKKFAEASAEIFPLNSYEDCVGAGYEVMEPDCVGCQNYCQSPDGIKYYQEEASPESICVDKCGDGVCQEVVCMGQGCPCAETVESCPQDCQASE